MFDIMIRFGEVALPVFIFCTMANVGMTQDPLGTAQRNTAAAMLIANSSFTDKSVLVLITLVNMIGIAVLIVLAKLLRGTMPGYNSYDAREEERAGPCGAGHPAR